MNGLLAFFAAVFVGAVVVAVTARKNVPTEQAKQQREGAA